MDEKQKKQFDYQNKYNSEKYDRLSIVIQKGKREAYREYAISRGYKSLTALIVDLIEADMQENTPPGR